MPYSTLQRLRFRSRLPAFQVLLAFWIVALLFDPIMALPPTLPPAPTTPPSIQDREQKLHHRQAAGTCGFYSYTKGMVTHSLLLPEIPAHPARTDLMNVSR